MTLLTERHLQTTENPKVLDTPLTWEEIRTHDKMTDLWMVIDGYVYDLTRWVSRHPGGRKILGFYAGQDATEAWLSFHNDRTQVQKYMKPLCLGKLQGEDPQQTNPIRKDFRQLRETAEKTGLFQPDYRFYAAHLAHIVLIYLMAYLAVRYLGDGWRVVLLAGVLLATAQVQAGWLQHDFGHLSVFKTMWLENLFHQVTIGLLKGSSSGLWRNHHYRHHAKTNVMEKDPDILEPPLFVLGDIMPVEEAKKYKKTLFYNYQHLYYALVAILWLFVPYHSSVFIFSIKRKRWQDIVFSLSFYVVFLAAFLPEVGVLKTVILYIVMRAIESPWYLWVIQMTHMGMEVGREKNEPWMAMQMHATFNVEQSFFTDWFMGHLNYHIEHHLFPTMPRHNFHKASPLVRSVCKKHGLDYEIKSLAEGFGNTLRFLKKSGDIWMTARASISREG